MRIYLIQEGYIYILLGIWLLILILKNIFLSKNDKFIYKVGLKIYKIILLIILIYWVYFRIK